VPRTVLGRLSAGLLGGFVVMLGLFFVIVASGQRGGDAYIDNLWLALPMTAAAISGAAAGLIGLWAIVGRSERAPIIFVALAVGFVVIAWSSAEVLLPHG
jgi:hypothetical protein